MNILFVHAHPDDETINNGATMAAYVAAGHKVTLVTCTRGEEGEVLVADLAHLAADQSDQLGAHRELELAAAMRELGVVDHRFLGAPNLRWRDSGMMGTAPNERTDNFWQADLAVATSALVEVILETAPDVLVTYDENGGYGHPDHIQTHRVAMAAAKAAADQHQIKKIYWNIMPESVLQAGIDRMKEAGNNFFQVDHARDLPFCKSDEFVTAKVSAPQFVPAKLAALRQHATQINVDGGFFALSNNVGAAALGDEYYTLVQGDAAAPFDENGYETDLLNGLGV